ncbi:MAG TPA: hypothetical protein VG826_10725 [Pirellulales bacterium]|nr:hypothetical protein [Pirellulales bacterium]
MSTHTIEPGQRLQMLVGDSSTTVSVISEAIVPAGYWICRDESCGQQRVVAHTVLAPLAALPVAPEGACSDLPATATAA